MSKINLDFIFAIQKIKKNSFSRIIIDIKIGSDLEFGSISTRSDVHRRSSSMAAIVYGVEDYRSTAR